jgi:hypothetical protein
MVSNMAKKAIATSTEVAKPKKQGKVRVTNMMQCDWIVPPKLLGLPGVDSNCLIRPLGSVVFYKEDFDRYMGTKVFQAMFDLKLLISSEVDVMPKVDRHDLTSAPIVEPPPELKGEGKERKLEICNKPVTLDINSQIIGR